MSATANQEPQAEAKREAVLRCTALLGELWTRLKLLDAHCTDSMAVALTPRSFDCIEGQRMAFREIQHWLVAHGYSPNDKITDAGPETPGLG